MNTFEWCGYNWRGSMSGGSLIHPDQSWMWYSLDTIKVDKDETLEFFIKYNPKDIKHWNGNTYHSLYEVSTMRSAEDFSYGTFSAELMMPKGKNLSASFWLTGSGNWPPEIDIEEGFLDNTGNWFKCFENYFPWIRLGWRTTTNMHYRNEIFEKTHVGSRNIPYAKQRKDPSENWIEYRCKWEPDRITFYANNRIVREVVGEECEQLTRNLKDPEKGFNVNVVLNVWTENPDKCKIDMVQPMLVRNFKYKPL